MELDELKKILIKSWNRDTCISSLKNEWSEENPSLGQCAITSLVVNDIYGGKIMRCMTPYGSHYYNVVNDEIIDLTIDQFLGYTPNYELSEERTRAYLLNNVETKKRYLQLNKNLEKYIDSEMRELKNILSNEYIKIFKVN